MPHSLEYIGEFAFLLTDYYNNEICKNEQNVVYIGEYCISSQQGSEYSELFPDSYTIKQGTKLIATSAFFRADRLNKIIIPNGVEYINDGAFFWCQSLKSVVIPNDELEKGNDKLTVGEILSMGNQRIIKQLEDCLK